jgi:hypothetical protein
MSNPSPAIAINSDCREINITLNSLFTGQYRPLDQCFRYLDFVLVVRQRQRIGHSHLTGGLGIGLINRLAPDKILGLMARYGLL